jgi:hypothetical protein
MWLYDSTGDVVINHDGVSGANPELASLPIQAGTTRYVIRVVPYTVLPTGTASPAASRSVPGPAPPPDIFHAADHIDGTDVFSCNLHLSGVDENGRARQRQGAGRPLPIATALRT